jgi:hypothetical protein
VSRSADIRPSGALEPSPTLAAVGSAIAVVCVGGYASSVAPKVALLAALVLLGVLAGWLVRPVTMATAVLAATFVTALRLHAGAATVFPEQVLLFPLGISLLSHSMSSRIWRALEQPPVVLLAVFVVYSAFISLLMSPDPASSLRVVAWMGLSWVLLVLVLATFSKAVEIERRMVAITLVVAALSIALYVFDQLTGNDLATHVEPFSGGSALSGFSSEQNVFAGVLAVWIFVAVTSREFRYRWYYGPSSALATVALLLSLTRSAVLALVVGVCVWAVLDGGRNSKIVLRWLAVAAVSVVVGALLFPSVSRPVTEKLSPSELLNVSSGTGAQRSENVSGAISELAGGDWIAGLGTNSYGERHFDLFASTKEAYLPSLPVQVIYDSGLVGLFALALAYGFLTPWNRPGRSRAIGCTVVFMIASFATSTFWFGSTWVIIALALLSAQRAGDVSVGEMPTDVPAFRP